MRISGKIAKTVFTLSLGTAVVFSQEPTTPAQPGATTKQSDVHGQGKHSADHGMSSNKGAGVMVGRTDEQFMMKAAQGTMAEIEAARLAQEKASSSEIKEFARKLEQDHSKASDQLKQLAEQKNVQLPADMGKHKEQVDKIRNLSGDQFDKAYMKMQVSHHKKDVSEFQKHTNRSMDSDVRTFASNTLPTLQEHLRQAQELQGSTRGRKAAMPADSSATPTSNAPDSSSKPRGENNPPTTK